ncbi:hypothetical protein QAD02_009556 [Eretmocerus hayati]|uniref:Uncharacterized protein n=1 Tax=Eretmocerus hayati TaxID=131215 RepID=A0ACC2NAX0_9HYME|nr:hypothetical protein QAD02_009556 [Eretmocerus hayati]
MASRSDDEEDFGLPQHILDAARDAVESCLPKKSRPKYEKEYETFVNWKLKSINKPGIKTTEPLMLAYFSKLVSDGLVVSTLWSKWSMLKTMIQSREDVDISTFIKLKRLLKERKEGYRVKQAAAFCTEELKKFLTKAPDAEYLDVKVAVLLGILGACRREELKNMLLADILIEQDSLIITIPQTKTGIVRTFAVNVPWKDLVLRYISLRPKNIKHDSLFINYQNGKCTSQPMGINKLGGMPQKVAKYLNLKNPERYTGHAFRRTSATFLADAGASLTTLKRHGGWRSDATAEAYIADSRANKRKIGDQIGGCLLDEESCDTS